MYRRDPPRVDPTGPTDGGLRVLRGGGWNTFSTNMRVSNRLTSNLEGSSTGARCARAGTAGNPDAVEPLRVTTLSGDVRGGEGPLIGRALYITAFDAADLDPSTGRMPPGRSPAAETRLTPTGAASMAFSLEVPVGGSYIVMATLDAGAPEGGSGAWDSPGASGGSGLADQNPVTADADGVTGLTVTLQKLASGAGPGGAPPRGTRPPTPGGAPGAVPPSGAPAGSPPSGAPAGGSR